MFRDEIDSGALENAAFVNGGFRDYLLSKMLIMALIGLAAGAALFGVLAACGLALGQARITSAHLAQFLAGSLAGLYYSAIGGYLSFFFRAGSNVLIVIIGQVFLAIVFFLSMTSRQSWVEAVFSGDLRRPGFAAQVPRPLPRLPECRHRQEESSLDRGIGRRRPGRVLP